MVNPTLVSNSIFQKGLIALSGLLLVLFLLFHLGGNFLLLGTPGTYNHLAQTLEAWGWVFHGAEIMLLAAFITHIGLTIHIRRQQQPSTPRNLHRRQTQRWVGAWGVNLTSRLMVMTGPLILGFLIVHLNHFRFHPGARNLEAWVHQLFQSPGWVATYELALLPLGLHLAHGIGSSWQSLGLGHPHITPLLPRLSQILSLLIMLGYAVIPLAMFPPYL